MATWLILRRWQRLRFSCVRRAGIWIYHIKLARVRRLSTAEGIVFAKTRYWRTSWLIALAHPLLRATHSALFGLPEQAWLAWEVSLAPIALRCHAQVQGRTLKLPLLPGVRLADYLYSARAIDMKWRAIRSAARELHRLHGIIVPFPDGQRRHFSHGDAHFKNVFFDEVTGQATWFDFEAVHASQLPTSRRHADDWRALAFSVATCFTHGDLPALATLIAQECQDVAVRNALGTVATQLARTPDTFHLAQAPLDFLRHQAFCKALQEALESSYNATD